MHPQIIVPSAGEVHNFPFPHMLYGITPPHAPADQRAKMQRQGIYIKWRDTYHGYWLKKRSRVYHLAMATGCSPRVLALLVRLCFELTYFREENFRLLHAVSSYILGIATGIGTRGMVLEACYYSSGQ